MEGTRMGIYLDPGTRARLEYLAAATRRSMGGVIRALVQSAELRAAPDVRAGQQWQEAGEAGPGGAHADKA